MGNETKWADVAHYYLRSGIKCNVYRGDLTERRGDCKHTVETFGIKHLRVAADSMTFGCVPILCHRDDITEAQAREICEPMIESLKEVEGDSFEPPKSYKEFLLRPFTHKGTWSLLDHALGNPRDWHKFIKWGIDVFRLIESGQAIRKEVGNG